ncbi:MAG: hypothetical protein ACFFC7_34615, partial [Candidatus Hermodarchaeota archaeon]
MYLAPAPSSQLYYNFPERIIYSLERLLISFVIIGKCKIVRSTMRTILLSSLLTFLIVFTAFSGTVHVPEDTSSIQGGIYLANDGDTVLVAPGIYAHTHRILISGFQDSVNACVIIKPGVVLMSESDPENTIIK